MQTKPPKNIAYVLVSYNFALQQLYVEWTVLHAAAILPYKTIPVKRKISSLFYNIDRTSYLPGYLLETLVIK